MRRLACQAQRAIGLISASITTSLSGSALPGICALPAVTANAGEAGWPRNVASEAGTSSRCESGEIRCWKCGQGGLHGHHRGGFFCAECGAIRCGARRHRSEARRLALLLFSKRVSLTTPPPPHRPQVRLDGAGPVRPPGPGRAALSVGPAGARPGVPEAAVRAASRPIHGSAGAGAPAVRERLEPGEQGVRDAAEPPAARAVSAASEGHRDGHGGDNRRPRAADGDDGDARGGGGGG